MTGAAWPEAGVYRRRQRTATCLHGSTSPDRPGEIHDSLAWAMTSSSSGATDALALFLSPAGLPDGARATATRHPIHPSLLLPS